MESCSLQDLGPAIDEDDVPFHADFTGAVMVGAHFSFRKFVIDPFVGIFRNAVLDATVWEKRGVDMDVCDSSQLCSIVAPDFRDASLRGSRFPAARFGAPCTFQGADLTSADFRANPPRDGTVLTRCRFDREPESGRISFRPASPA